MEFIDYLRSVSQGGTTDYTAFIRQYRRDEKSIHIFYEGYEDPSFYMSTIRECGFDDVKVYYHRAKNKANIYRYFGLIDWRRYQKHRVLFFTDKDFSDVLNTVYPESSNIYVTEFYSIENYVVTSQVLERILVDYCRISDAELIQRVIEMFESAYDDFSKKVLPLIAWIIYHRRAGRGTQLNNINMDRLMWITLDFRVQNRSTHNDENRIQYLDRVCQVSTENNCWVTILNIIRELQGYIPKKIIRGKFDLWFYMKFINHAISTLNTNLSPNPRITLKVPISASSALITLSPIAKKPQSLKDFIIDNYSKL